MFDDKKSKWKSCIEILVSISAIAGFIWSITGFMINQNDITNLQREKRILENSPKYKNPLETSIVDNKLLVENISKVSLHNVTDEYQELSNPNTIIIGRGDVLDMLPGEKFLFIIPEQFKKLKVNELFIVRITYLFNNDPLNIIDTRISLERLNDPFYEYNKRFSLLEERKNSTFILKFDGEKFGVVK